MATVDEILTRQAYAAGDGAWTKDNNYPSYTLYVEPEYVPVTNKRIADFNDQVSVRGEQNAQFVGFQLPRYDDGIDLTAAHLYIHYQTVYGGSDSIPCNVSWTDNYIRLCWQVPAQATQEPDRVQMMIYATGINSMGERVTWKTLPASYTIHDGLDIGGGIPEPDPSWYEQFVAQMEGKVSTAQGYANDAQASKTAAAGSAAESAQSAAASAKALEDNRAYVESQKETFVGYNKRETDLKYANALIGTASGMGRVTVGDAWEAPVADMDISGRSEQFSTTGAQLFDASKLVRTHNEVDFSMGENGGVLVTGNTLQNAANSAVVPVTLSPGTYYISGSTPIGNSQIFVRIKLWHGDSSSVISDASFSVDGTETKIECFIQLYQGLPDFKAVVYPMLNTGETALPWEPYTGAKPSPSPEYPQEIVGTDVTAVTVTGAQLMDTSKLARTHNEVTFSIREDGGILVTGNTLQNPANSAVVSTNLPPGTYCVSGSVPAADPKIFVKAKKWYSDGTSVVINDTSFDVDGTETKIDYFVQLSRGLSDINEIVYPMLNAGPTVIPWQPYQSSTATITLTEPLRGIGDVRDRIMCRDGVWGIERYVALRELTEGIVYSNQGGQVTPNNIIDNRYVAIWTDNYKGIISKTAYADSRLTAGYCNIAGAGKVGEWNKASGGKENIYTINSNGNIFVTVPIGVLGIGVDVGIDEVNAAVKQYVADHDVYVMFVLNTPTWEPLPSAAQSALNALTTYTGTTHVTITAGGPEPDVAVEYVQDTRAVVADLQAQIDAIRNGGTT